MKKILLVLSIAACFAAASFAQQSGAQTHGEGQPVNQSIGPPETAFSTSDTFNGSNLVTYHCVARAHGNGPSNNVPFTITVTSVTNASPGVFTTAAHGFQGGELINVPTGTGPSNVPAGKYQVVYISPTTFSLEDPTTGVAVNTSASSTGGVITTDAPLLNQPVWSIQVTTYSGSNPVRKSYVFGDPSMSYICANAANLAHQ